MPDLALRLATGQVAQTGRLRASTVAKVTAAWRSTTPINDRAAAEFVALAGAAVEGAQRVAVASAASYVARQVAAAGARPGRLPDLAAVLSGLRPANEVAMRAVIHTRALLGEGRTVTDALAGGLDLAQRNAAMDVQLANRAGEFAAMEADPKVVGYRRVPDGGACEFCLMASTQRYHLEVLMPLHHRCGCGTAPIVGDADPGQVVDHELLARLKGVTTTVTLDPELGPVLSGSLAA